MAFDSVILAQAGAAGGGIMQMLPLIALMFAIMYFMVIRPQQKQLKEHQSLLGGLKKGDDVVTQGGLLGKIHVIADKVVTLEVANGVRIRVLKTSIQGRAAATDDAPVKVTEAEKKEEK